MVIKQNQKWIFLGLVIVIVIILGKYEIPETESFIDSPDIILPPEFQEKPHYPADNPRWGSGCRTVSDCLNFPPDSYAGTFMYDGEGNPIASIPEMICEGGLCKWL